MWFKLLQILTAFKTTTESATLLEGKKYVEFVKNTSTRRLRKEDY